MIMYKKELWLNIANYHFDQLVPTHLWDEIVAKFGGENPFVKAFAEKLCRKFEWKKSFALKAIWEYKKFVYMGVISDFSITPSKVIDKVWHEHLLFSVGYRKFCKEVIKYDFDHHPELVPLDCQTEVFKSQYFYTIVLYKKEFGCEPPSDIWEETKFRGTSKNLNEPKRIITESTYYYETEPLISMFPNIESGDVENGSGEFGGGEFGGAGSGGSWDDADDDSSDSDSGDSGGDSSCSGGCSGGCGGGGD